MCGSAANAADTLASSPAADSDGMQKVANRELVSAPNTFEFDDIAVQAIPEPAIWMMLILGTVGAGFAMRRPASESIGRVRYLRPVSAKPLNNLSGDPHARSRFLLKGLLRWYATSQQGPG